LDPGASRPNENVSFKEQIENAQNVMNVRSNLIYNKRLELKNLQLLKEPFEDYTP